jgi:pimeloyl-ACP methyl ester carboxylesterase
MSVEDWYEAGYVPALCGAYRLVLVDARGHGASGKPHDPDAYRIERRVADVLAVLDDLGIAEAHFLGYSMGAYIGFDLAVHARERFRSLVLGGGDPGWRASGQADPVGELLRRGLEACAAARQPVLGPRMTPAVRARLLSNDVEAWLASRLVAEQTLEEALPRVAVPCLLFAGDADQPAHDKSKAASARMARASFVSLPGLNHIEGFYRVDLVAPYVLAFLATVP